MYPGILAKCKCNRRSNLHMYFRVTPCILNISNDLRLRKRDLYILNYLNMEPSKEDRIIVLVDMDCFYVQVEQNLYPEFQNKPCAVVQYNQYKGGGIIAVNYEARAKGVTRMLRGDEARKMCPEIHLFKVPEVRGKADLTRYRDAGAKVLHVLCEYSDCVERASIDEAYLDMTSVINEKMQNIAPVTAEQIPNTFVIGWENEDPEIRKTETKKWLQMIYEEDHLYNDRMLAVTAVIVEEMRANVFEKTGYRCSAGIAHNKMLAKLSCGIHKPNKQTVLPQSSIQILYKSVPIKKVRNLGGKFGEEIVKRLNIEKMGDLYHFPKSELVTHFGEKNGHWLYNLARGIENEPVVARQLPKSIGCGKNFTGKLALSTKKEVTHWLKQLASELEERLVKDQETNRRVARLLTISVRTYENNCPSTTSRSCPIHVYDAEKIAHDALNAINKLNTSSGEDLWKPSIWTLSMAASKFEDKLDSSSCNIQSYFTISSKEGNNKSYNNEEQNINFKIDQLSFSDVCSENTNAVVQKSNILEKSKKNNTQNITSFFKKKELQEKVELHSFEVIPETNIKAESANTSVKDESSCDTLNDESMENTKSSNIDDPGCSEKHDKPVIGFFARKLTEISKFSLDNKIQETSKQNISSKLFESQNENFVSETKTSNISTCNEVEESIIDVIDEDNLTNLDPELVKICEKCKKHIPVWEELEHLDYHLAVNLSNELSQNDQNSIRKFETGGKNTAVKHKSGRKRGNVNKTNSKSKKQATQTNTLDSFIKSKT